MCSVSLACTPCWRPCKYYKRIAAYGACSVTQNKQGGTFIVVPTVHLCVGIRALEIYWYNLSLRRLSASSVIIYCVLILLHVHATIRVIIHVRVYE